MSSTKRISINKNKRAFIWEKNFGNKSKVKCPCCGKKVITLKNCHISHKVALARGGSNSTRNLIPLCSKCNLSMGTRYYRDYIRLF